jgi:hypothetical protein
MTRAQAMALVALLKATYPREQFDEDRVSVWVQMLVDLPADAGQRAVGALIRESTWLPSVAEIRRFVVTEQLQLPTQAEAWANVEREVVCYHAAVPGPHHYYDPTWDHPVVAKVVQAIGWAGLVHGDNWTTQRAQFLRLYQEEREAAVRKANLDSAENAGLLPARPTQPALGPGHD